MYVIGSTGKIKNNLKFMSNTEVLSKGAESIGLMSSGISKFLSVDYSNVTSTDVGQIVSGCLDFVSSITAFLPPPASVITETIP